MHQKNNLKLLISAAALSLGLSASAWAQDSAAPAAATTTTATPIADAGASLLGSSYVEAAWKYYDLQDGPPGAARGFAFNYNQPITAGLDFNGGYDWAQAKAYGLTMTQHKLDLGVTAFLANSWGKPYVQALGGWEWLSGSGLVHDNSFVYTLGTGIEFNPASNFAVTPYVNFVRATGFNQNEFDVGVKASVRLNKDWNLTARVQHDAVRDSSDATEYSLGLAYRF